jgi:hypothetical protein
LNPAQQKLFNTDKVADIFPEHYIINIKNFNDIATDTLDEWIYFLKNEEIKDNFKAKGLLEAKEKLDVLKLNEADKIAYESYQKELHHQASIYESTYILGRAEERELQQQQRHQEKIALAKAMLKSGLSPIDAAKFSGLNEQEIELL